MKNKGRKYFSAFDVIIIFIVILASTFSLVSQFNINENDLLCVIRVEGEVYKTVPLSEVNEVEIIEVSGNVPLSVIVSEKEVYVESSCPDKLCEHSGKISKAHQSIVCLPAKVSVTLESDKDSDIDVVVG
ncbi:MAG: NusG domain II-containing protein [Ruminococcus sp.]|nr:NusG domain II-containing protein [Ruminococcus sp.]